MAGANGNRRVAVTGMGVVSSVGTNVEEFWASLRSGTCGIGPVRHFPLNDLYIKIAGEVKSFEPRDRLKTKALLLADRYSQFAAMAASEAVALAGLKTPFENGERAAAIVGSGCGGFNTIEKAYEDLFIHKKKASHPLTLLRAIGSSACAHVSIEHGIKGPVFGTVSACSTAAHAIGLALQMIRSGAVDVAIAGASESCLTYGTMRAWQAMRVLSPDGLFPFAKRRNGTVLSEGCGLLVLESFDHAKARGADPIAELKGFGMTSDAGDMVNPDIEGPAVAMQLALADAGLSPADIDYLNAHGTATALNDVNETRAIKRVFGRDVARLSISATKSMHGHCLGAGGGVEAIACIQAMRYGFAPPTIGLTEPGDECDLDYTANEGRHRDIGYAMSNSFAFGGLNAVLVFGPAAAW